MTLRIISASENPIEKAIKIRKKIAKLDDVRPNFSVNRDLEAKKVGNIKHDIQDNGEIKPLFTDEKGLVDGHHRYAALKELDVDKVPVYELQGDLGKLPKRVQKKIAGKFNINPESLQVANNRDENLEKAKQARHVRTRAGKPYFAGEGTKRTKDGKFKEGDTVVYKWRESEPGQKVVIVDGPEDLAFSGGPGWKIKMASEYAKSGYKSMWVAEDHLRKDKIEKAKEGLGLGDNVKLKDGTEWRIVERSPDGKRFAIKQGHTGRIKQVTLDDIDTGMTGLAERMVEGKSPTKEDQEKLQQWLRRRKGQIETVRRRKVT